MHIDDCGVEAILRIMDRVRRRQCRPHRLGKSINFREVARCSPGSRKYQPEISRSEDKPVGVHSRYADISLMKSVLGWQPTISIEEGFGRVLRVAHERKTRGL